ncbi:MAG: class I SAM-dependent methyltransferase [Phycisphaerales bacterium]|jgi:SAM-dependent methyltransferase|nr:class I SAM-dependent methyltransferase [Phycisphaerales bacterium]
MSRARSAGSEAAQPSLYTDPLVYDVLHGPGTAEEADAIERIAARFVEKDPAKMAYLEPACGTARILRAMARRGRRVVGFDLSETMIAFARERLAAITPEPRARAFVADMTGFARELDRASIDCAFCTINTIRHLPDDESMRACFGEMARALTPRGVFIVGLNLSDWRVEGETEDLWDARRGSMRVRQIVQYMPPSDAASARRRFERVISHVTVETPSRVVHDDCAYDLRCYSEAQWAELVDRSALVEVGVVDERARDVEAPAPTYALRVLARRKR